MRKLKKILGPFLYRHRHRLPLRWQRRYFKCVTLKPKRGPIRGRVLLSYALTSAGLPSDHPMFAYHTGPWESNQIIRMFNRRGFIVDCIHYTNRSFVPRENYDIIFACTAELYRLVAAMPRPEKVVKIWHSVVSAIDYNNAAEINRIKELQKRRPGALYFPKRQEPHERLFEPLMELVDYCVLFGNDYIQNTFPAAFHPKITRITVSGSPLSYVKPAAALVPPEKEWLWFFGNGAVRKGLDLALEAFAKHPEWRLNVIGLAAEEPDFVRLYRRELFETANIKYHGYLNPGSEKFNAILKRCFAYIAPSATESISTAVVTILQAGLYPLLSYDTGITLPLGAGMYLEELTVAEIEKQVAAVQAKSDTALAAETGQVQALALKEFSRENFLKGMGDFIDRVLKENNLLQ